MDLRGCRRFLTGATFIFTVVLMAGCSQFSTSPYVPEDPGIPSDPRVLVFEDDFSQDTVGNKPTKWVISGDNVAVIAVEEPARGNVAQILGDSEQLTQMSVNLSINATAVLAEYSLRWVKGAGLNYYLDSTTVESGTHNVNLFVADSTGHLAYRYTDEAGKTVTANIGELGDKWNVVRILARADRNQVYIFFNDLTEPVLGPLPFRTSVQEGEWSDIRLIFYDSGRSANLAESYYDDVKVWRLAADDARDFLLP